MTRVALTTHDDQFETIDHFARVANLAQDLFQVETVELSPEEDDSLGEDAFLHGSEDELYGSLYRMKIDHGYEREDLFVAFTDAKLVDSDGGEFFAWCQSLGEQNDPGVAVVSLAYLNPAAGVLDKKDDKVYAANSVVTNALCSLVLLSTEIGSHYETMGCPMDYCMDMQDINYSLRNPFVFCKRWRCCDNLEQSEAGKAVAAIAEALRRHPIRFLADLPMMPHCFKTAGGKCPKVKRASPLRVFIGMPFKGFYEDVFEFAIKPTLEELGYSHWKANDHPNIIDLMCKVCEGIQESEFAVVDLSELNPNVFFELGLCYALGRKAVLVKKDDADVPVDLRGIEYIAYSSARDLRTKLATVIPRVFL